MRSSVGRSAETGRQPLRRLSIAGDGIEPHTHTSFIFLCALPASARAFSPPPTRRVRKNGRVPFVLQQQNNIELYHFPTLVPPTTFFPPRSHHRCRTPTSAWRDARRRRARVPHAARGSLRCRPTVQSCQQRLSCLKDALPRMELWSRRPRPLLFLLRQPTRKAKRELHRRHGVASTLRSLRSLYPRLRLQGRRIQ